MPRASSKLMFLTALVRIGLASTTAISAARFIVSINSSACFFMPRVRIIFSAARADSGSGILTRLSPKKPLGLPSCSTATSAPRVSASFRPDAVSLFERSAPQAGAMQAKTSASHRILLRLMRLALECMVLSFEAAIGGALRPAYTGKPMNMRLAWHSIARLPVGAACMACCVVGYGSGSPDSPSFDRERSTGSCCRSRERACHRDRAADFAPACSTCAA